MKSLAEVILTEEDISEMSKDKLLAYRNAAKDNYVSKIDTNRKKSLRRAKFVQKADLKIVGEDAAPATAVGTGHVAGANGDPPMGKKAQKKYLRRLNPNLTGEEC